MHQFTGSLENFNDNIQIMSWNGKKENAMSEKFMDWAEKRVINEQLNKTEPLIAFFEQFSIFKEQSTVASRRGGARLAIPLEHLHLASFGNVAASFEFLPRDAAEIDH